MSESCFDAHPQDVRVITSTREKGAKNPPTHFCSHCDRFLVNQTKWREMAAAVEKRTYGETRSRGQRKAS